MTSQAPLQTWLPPAPQRQPPSSRPAPRSTGALPAPASFTGGGDRGRCAATVWPGGTGPPAPSAWTIPACEGETVAWSPQRIEGEHGDFVGAERVR
jgi:hypothetical protein